MSTEEKTDDEHRLIALINMLECVSPEKRAIWGGILAARGITASSEEPGVASEHMAAGFLSLYTTLAPNGGAEHACAASGTVLLCLLEKTGTDVLAFLRGLYEFAQSTMVVRDPKTEN